MTSARLAVGAGHGRLARRADGLLFVGSISDAPRWAQIIDAYLDAASADEAREAVTAAAVETGFAIDPFAMVTWGATIELLVLGDVCVHTDLPSVPELAGTRGATWVEHRVARPPAGAHVAAGTAAEAGTRLDAGAAIAGGFALTLTTHGEPGVEVRPIGRSAPPSSVSVASTASPWGAPAVAVERSDVGDWDHDDPEATIGPRVRSDPAPVSTGFAPPRGASAMPGLVRTRRCAQGHPNPPHAAQCRTCGELIGATSRIETIAQPVLGRVVLPDGSTIAVDGTSVLGRKPDTVVARTESTARLVPLDVGQGVSRTHVVIRAEGWTMTATDCASRGRTVLRSPGAAEPEALEPWVPHELQPGDTIYLGGPTQLQVIAARSEQR